MSTCPRCLIRINNYSEYCSMSCVNSSYHSCMFRTRIMIKKTIYDKCILCNYLVKSVNYAMPYVKLQNYGEIHHCNIPVRSKYMNVNVL